MRDLTSLRGGPEGDESAAEHAPGKATLTRHLQRRARGPAADGAEEAVANLPGGGSALPEGPRAGFEASLGTDLAGVRVHTGPESAHAADALGARAFTTGQDIHFGHGEYKLDDPYGMHLLAHEVAHTVQQGPGGGGPQTKLTVSQPGDALEGEADRAADAMVQGAPATVSRGVGGSIQRREDDRDRESDRRSEDAARGREQGNGELERRTDGDNQRTDGSGEWGANADDRGLTDRASWTMWTQVANAAEGLGLTNAARHMRHYLGNTGATLDVSVDNMLRDVESFRTAYDQELEEARTQANERIAGLSAISSAQTFTLTGERRSNVYCNKGESQDWFFAIGGFTHWWTAEVTVTPLDGAAAPTPTTGPTGPAGAVTPAPAPAPTSTPGAAPAPSPTATPTPTPGGGAPAPTGPRYRVTMRFVMHMQDRYNWDQGKQVTIAGITVRDEQLGRLHRVGLAQEFDVQGQSSARAVEWTYDGAGSSTSNPTAPQGGDRDGARSDPTRSRDSALGNPRGSDGAPRGR